MNRQVPEPTSANGLLAAASHIDVSLGGRPVLSDVSLELPDGEIITLIGPNGSGKTTLIRVLLGLTKPDRGSVRLRAGLTIGYLPQRLQMDAILPLTAARFLTLRRRQTKAQIAALLEEVGAPHIADADVQALSGGEFQRLLLARALIGDPDLLVLDEPLQGVDFTGQINLFQLIKEVRETRGCGVLMVSHDLHLVMAGTHHVVCLSHHVCCSGQAEAVSQHPEYLALFGPRAAENLAVYTHAHDHHHDLSGGVVPIAHADHSPDHRHDHGHGSDTDQRKSLP